MKKLFSRSAPFVFSLSLACGSAVAHEAEQADERVVDAILPPAEPGPADLAEATPPETSEIRWQRVLTNFVTDDGGFRYEALMADADAMADLRAVVETIGTADVSGLSRDAQLAHRINAYNALVVHSVVELWPLDGVLTVPGFFDQRKVTVGGVEMTLNDLENTHIREAFHEPRIHFLVNCASAGCPWLINEVITAENLEAKLEAQATSYIRRTTQVDAAARKVLVSEIFNWFAADFEAAGGARAFVAARLEGDAQALLQDPGTALEFFPYDWTLNKRP